MPIAVLIVSEDSQAREFLPRQLFEDAAGEPLDCETSDSNAAMARMAFVRPDVVLLDAMAFDPALASLRQLRRLAPETPVLLRTGALDARSVLAAVRSGACGAVCTDDAASVVARAVRCVSQGDVWFGRGDLVAALKMRRIFNEPVTPVTFGNSESRLTQREDQVLDLIGAGLSNKEIARLLEISDKTVKTHLHRVYVKLNQSGRYKALLAQGGEHPRDLSWAPLAVLSHPVASDRLRSADRPGAGDEGNRRQATAGDRERG